MTRNLLHPDGLVTCQEDQEKDFSRENPQPVEPDPALNLPKVGSSAYLAPASGSDPSYAAS